MSDYLLGLLTLPAVAVVGCLIVVTMIRISAFLAARGWFIEAGPIGEEEATAHATRLIRGRLGLYRGTYQTTAGWGSRWISVGTRHHRFMVTVGRKHAHPAVAA